MEPLLTAAQMKAADQQSIEDFGLLELILMEHAGMALCDALLERFADRLSQTAGVVLAGPGNNGGDALVATRLLMEKGCQKIFVVLIGAEKALSPSTQKQLEILARLGVAWGKNLSAELLNACDWCLDGLLGTGLNRPVEGAFVDCIEQLNAFAGRKWIVSADIPSGLCADTGQPKGVAVRASRTVTFGFFKRGLVTGEAVNYVGELSLAPIQIPRTVRSDGWESFLYTEADACRLPIRKKSSHKGDFGRVAIVAGPPNREGAAALAALGALKTGAGLVTVFASAASLSGLRPRLAAEVMSEALGEVFFEHPSRLTIAIGPGLGTDAGDWNTLRRTLKRRDPVVVDADGLTLLAKNRSQAMEILKDRQGLPTVLTPHPKEAAVLLGTTTEEIERDRFAAARALSERWGAAIILKGSGSLCTTPGSPLVAVKAGDSGLSKGGSGDVLSGIVASFLAQNLTVAQALPLAVYVHGRASELLTRRYGHSRSSLAGEVAQACANVLEELEWKAKESTL